MENRQYRVILPMRIQTSSRKKTPLNLNVYRNLHFRSLSALKNKFHKLAKELLKDIPPLGRIRLHYSICPESKRKLDIGNVGSIVDKFFSDSLTEYGIIEDDNYEYLDRVSFGFGGIVKKEHVLVTITEIEPRKGLPMRILLDQIDIQNALDTFVMTQGITGATDVEMTVDDEGQITAEVMIGEAVVAKPTRKTPAKRRTKAQIEADNKAEEQTNVDESAEDSDAGSGSGNADSAETESSEVETKDDTPTKATKGGGKQKNLFEESQEASSTGADGDSSETEKGGDTPPVKTAKKSSIFDQ